MFEEKDKTKPNEIQKKLEECEKLKNEYLIGWQRSRADFLNYKKEELERIEELIKYADMGIILKILPILDNFEKAEKEIPDDKKNNNFLNGVLQIKIQLQDFLKSQGLEEIKSVGERFDPNLHEIVKEVEVKDPGSTTELTTGQGKESGIIVEEIQKGYTINNKLLRPARVKVVK